MFTFHPLKNSFGIDISDLRLRLLQVYSSGNHLRIRSFNEIIVPEGLIVEGEIHNMGVVTDLCKQLIHGAHGKKVTSKYVMASLPERKTFFKVFTIPILPDNEISGAVRWGIEQNIPVTLDSIVYDWQILKRDEATKQVTVAVAAIPKEIPTSYTQLLESVGLVPVALETESNAIARCVTNQQTHNNATMIIDMGASRTSLILIDQGVIHYSSTLELSGHDMTHLIAQKIRLTDDQAEKAKLICGLDEKRGKGLIRKTLLPMFDVLRAKAQEVQLFYQNTMQRKAPLQVVLCGGVSQMYGLKEYLATLLRLPVTLGDPFLHFPRPQQRKGFPESKALPFTTSIGVALKPFIDNDSPLP